MKANSPLERLYNGIIKENPTFVLMLGMCPTLAVTTSAKNGFGMGMTTMVILALSNLMISMLRKMIPDSVRMPAYIVVVASFVTIVQFLLQGFIPSLYVQIPGHLHSADRCKLYYSGPRGGLCHEEQRPSVCIRRNRHGTWIYRWAYQHRYRP